MRLMTRSGLRRSADIILVMAVTGAIAYVAVVWTVGNWGDTSLWDMATHALLPYWMGALTRVCIVVMAYAAVRSLTGTEGARMGRVVWAALIVALCSSLTSRMHSYFRWGFETAIPAVVLEAALIGMVFLLAQFAIRRASSGEARME